MREPTEATSDGYLLSYFLNENEPDGEQIRFAVSSRENPLRWEPLASGKPVVTSTVGTKGVRDPFLIRDTRRDRFLLLGTNFRAWPDQDWETAVRYGSRSIVIWESPDLLNWSDPWLAQIAPPEAGNAWAPKAFWSAERDCWVVFWASALFDQPDRSAGEYQRIMSTTTSDFRSFGEPQTYLDLGHDVIDATFIDAHNYFYRYSVNTFGRKRNQAGGHHIFGERGHSLEDSRFEGVATDIGHETIARGEGPAVATSADGKTWYLLIDEFGLRGYHLFSTHDLDSGRWTWEPDALLPAGARHGSLLQLTQLERAILVLSDRAAASAR